MAEPDVDLKGLLEKNTPGLGHTTAYRLDNVTIEVDLSGVEVVEDSIEGLPVSANGHFETRENPETGAALWVFKAHPLRQEVARGGPPLTGPPPPA